MNNKTCDACGSPKVSGSIGGAALCRTCTEDVRVEIDSLRAAGKSVNAIGIARRIFRESHSAGAYQLKDIPTELWDLAKHAAINKGISLRDLILNAIREYVK